MRITMETSLGPITLTEENGALTRLDFGTAAAFAGQSPLLEEACRQIREYLAGERKEFSLPLRPAGTPFQQRCYAALLSIPYGQAISYGEEARRIGMPKACRAVGGANGRNPLPILIPCHRVVQADGKLGGYSCGLEIKRKLLRLEGIPYRE